MKKSKQAVSRGGITAILLAVVVTLSNIAFVPQEVCAKSSEISLKAETYLFDGDAHYEFDEAQSKNPADISSVGTLKISGDVKSDGKENDFDKLNVSEGNIEIKYEFSNLSTDEEDWHIVSDKTDKVNGEKLNGAIKQGIVLIQTSLDGITWINSGEITDYFAEDRTDPIYTTSEIQLLNGCYYRILVGYKEEMKTGSKKVLFVNTNKTESRKIAEVYEFYAINEGAKNSESSSPEKAPRQVYEDKNLVVNTGKDNGYSEKNSLTAKDVHYGWGIGTFTVNGYTQTQENADGSTVFLKNVGDQVTLWFSLNQDINKLDQNESLAIANDKNGYDQYFQTKKTDMGRGTLIISYTDSQNHKYDPVIYTDYLAACSTTSADTRVVLYEEGDYEVALDYEIKSTPRKVGAVEVVPEYTNYRTYFKFSVHNSNAMLYPFDVATGSELQNRAVTSNGFRIDLANSKDLDVYVTQTQITVNGNGKHIEDSRGTKAAKDGSEYTKEGIYTLDVKNTYTKQETVKTIYVGSDPFLIALSNYDLSVKDLDNKLSDGYSITDDGKLVAPVVPESEAEVKDKNTAKTAEAGNETEKETGTIVSEEAEQAAEAASEDLLSDSDVDEKKDKATKGSFPTVPVIVIVVAICAAIAIFRKTNGGKKTGEVNSNSHSGNNNTSDSIEERENIMSEEKDQSENNDDNDERGEK